MPPKIRSALLGFFICLSLPTAVFAQIGGSGWSPLKFTFNVQSPTNAPQSARYFFTNNIYHCLTYSNDGAFSAGNTTLPRTEQRFTPDYTNGEIQYQATLMVPSNENSYCVFQIHTGDAESAAYGSTTFMLFWFTNNNGSVHDYSGTTLATNLGNQWFQLNVDHSLVSHTITVWINQQLVWTQQDNGAGDFYMKDGVYEQSHSPTYEMDTYITNSIKLWVSPGTNPPVASAASLTIQSLSGPVTATEINSFITYMQAKTPPPTPWGAVNGTTDDHNEWADGTGGREMEAMGEMYEVSSNLTILNQMINWADDCTSQRNDLMSATNGGQRVMWTGLIDKVWCPNEPTDMTDNQYLYCGCESEDTIGHLAFCAKLILENSTLWNTTVPDGNPYGYGLTYLQRATNYLAKCDEANDEYFLKWFIQTNSNLIVPPTNSAWTALDENVTANNRQMMFTSGFQRLAEAHELLGDNPVRVAQYDAIVLATVNQDLTGMIKFHPYTTNGFSVYDWGYYPTTDAPEATEIHAEYDIIGVWRAFNRSSYGYTLAPLVPFANTMVQVIYLGTNTFAGDVSGGSGLQSPIYSGWIFSADWNPAVYNVVAGAAYTNGWYSGSADIDAGILFMKNRRYQEFSVTPASVSQITQAGNGTSYTLAIAPLGGFTNVVNLTVSGFPAGGSGNFNFASVNLGALNTVSTNLTLSVATSASTPIGSYKLSIVGKSGSVSHTNTLILTVGNFSVLASPSSPTISPGQSTGYTITVATNTGFSGSVSLGVGNLPANCSASFSPVSLNGAGSAMLNVIASNNATAGSYTLAIFGTNGAVVDSTTAGLQIIGTATPIWNGGSTSDNDWSDSANWNGVSVVAGDTLIFSGANRLTNANDTASGTIYSNLVFAAGAGAFVLGGNPITVTGNITNNSSSPQTIALGLNFNSNLTFDGTSNSLILGGGLTNTIGTSGSTTLTLAGTGILTNILNSTIKPGGTNIIAINNSGDNWTLMNNPSSAAMTVPWVFNINGGTFNFGSTSSAPNLILTTPNNSPGDNLVGNASGVTGTFNMINGTLTTSARFDTASVSGSTGIINQTGGTFNMGSQFQGANGQNPGEVSIVNVSGGTMNLSGGSGAFYVASRDTGTLTVSGSGVVNCGTLDISRNAYGNSIGSVGIVNLNGGTILAGKVSTASANAQTNWLIGSAATFNFNGGTLKINSSTTPFFQGSTVAPIIPIVAVVKSGGAFIDSNGQTNIFAEPLLHDSTLGSAGDGGLTKNGSGSLILVSNVSYTGSTIINAGVLVLSNSVALASSPDIVVASGATLDVSGRNDGTLSLVSGQTLAGFGTIKGNTIAGSGSTLAPGNSIGTLTFNHNLTLNGGSVTVMAINKSASSSNDVVSVAGSLIYGGTLIITNTGTIPFSAGDNFKLFAAANYSGVFTNIVPAIPAVNLAWNMNGGVLNVVAAPTAPPEFASVVTGGNNLVFSGSNGVPNWPYHVLTSTNAALPINQWIPVLTNMFDAGGNFIFTNPFAAGLPQQFYLLKIP